MKNASRENSKSWVIAAICCFINFLHLGIARQSGLLYLAAIARYDANRNQASLPFVLCYTIRNVSGPFVGFLGRKVGLERVTIFGCVLASLGMAACFLAEDIITVTVLWGGVFGLGFGMGSVLIPVVLNQHFDKHLSNANGIAFGGECVAGFILPILVKILLNAFGTSGLFLILSGLMLHSVPAAMLLKISATKPSEKSAHKPIWVHNGSSDAVLFPTVNGIYNKSFNLEVCDKSLQVNSTHILNGPNMISVTKLETLNEDKSLYNNLAPEENTERCTHAHNGRIADSESVDSKSNYVLQEQHLNAIIAPQTMVINPNYIRSDNKCQNSESALSTIQCNGTEKPFTKESSKSSAFSSFRVFYDPAFILMLLTQSSFIFIGTMIMTIIVDLSRDAGVTSNEEIYILMCLSISDMIGRFGLGWVTDSGYMSTVSFSALCYFSLGIILTALVFLKGFILIMCAAFFIGLFLGGLLIVCPGVVSNHIEKEKITMALASRFVLYAPMSLTQSSLIGFFRGTKGSYNGILYMLTAVCLMCCAMSLSIPFATRIREKRKHRNKESQEKGKT
ncbi:monocarboxylate transporter 9-like [Argiope bruennichi]|uniref:Uncharacterized protein n=1 Tax=Argiope bruennichi TaxID=94029 RepID=A0A8T0EDM8_ARGBR|nr:monocarboxylate transporter 9-like [Argiope bruennichi]XP_055953461.1 monocarboxylate transporter 9-like [Argiope bruennichi]XP_055953462.1 monocarboxylate transporter 9-like [Argiope bruennichi]XP_055953464.1 monocarboxylate transporter 9-like [Argiope bruennichi]XP_055953465.1 monocarboxylate transporter 9-like [Argiope bruennichi]XP_055953466.1 monocarboxylate transporter 9-like [Argiope bruennichi]XP_055953467.1 monocarboxylate transporter 9-like [Argiope bruennichi]XP_055953468.1 mon